jgi:hypothetical protein
MCQRNVKTVLNKAIFIQTTDCSGNIAVTKYNCIEMKDLENKEDIISFQSEK